MISITFETRDKEGVYVTIGNPAFSLFLYLCFKILFIAAVATKIL